MAALYVFGALSVLFGAASGLLNIKDKPLARLLCKLTGSLFFLAVALGAMYMEEASTRYAVFVVAALIFGMLGDVFLCLNRLAPQVKSGLFFGLGMGAFFVGHLFFVGLFLSFGAFRWYLLPFAFLLPAALCIAVFKGVVKAGKVTIPMVIYSFLLNFMVVSTLNYYLNAPSVTSVLALTAGVLFLVSDTALCFRNFVKLSEKKVNFLVFLVLLTYYPAQVLFALTIIV